MSEAPEIAASANTADAAWWVYIILADDNSLYTGISTDVERRFQQHLQRRGGARYFHSRTPLRIVWREAHANRSQASQREAAIKRLSRPAKLRLIGSQDDAHANPDRASQVKPSK